MLVSIGLLVVFDLVLCLIEIPAMLKNKLYKELWVFSVLLITGTFLAVLKSLDVTIPNPADWVMTVYSPVTDLIKGLLK